MTRPRSESSSAAVASAPQSPPTNSTAFAPRSAATLTPAHQSREHDDCNVLCLGARVVGVELALEIVRAFVAARFTGEERHRRRLAKIARLKRKSEE